MALKFLVFTIRNFHPQNELIDLHRICLPKKGFTVHKTSVECFFSQRVGDIGGDGAKICAGYKATLWSSVALEKALNA